MNPSGNSPWRSAEFLQGPRFQSFQLWTQAQSPVEAEVRCRFTFAEPVPDLEIRGRLVGPHCPYASTVEVAYPFRTVPGGAEQLGTATARVIIPEPSFWEPACPFLYEGTLEGWRGGNLAFRVQLRLGIRQFHLGPRGLRWNGQPLVLRGVVRAELAETDARQLHDRGVNTILLPLTRSARAGEADFVPKLVDLYKTADRLGFLVLAWPENLDHFRLTDACDHCPSFLGWLLPSLSLTHTLDWFTASHHVGQAVGRQVLGAFLDESLAEEVLQDVEVRREIAFIGCRETLFSRWDRLTLPKLLLVEAGSRPDEAVAARPDVLGWIEL